MIYTAHPVWMHPPTWGEQIIERLDWKTDVLSGELGTEQRVARRLTPRRSFTASFYLQKTDRQQFEYNMAARGSQVWVIPVWHDVSTLDADAASGASVLSVDTQYREFLNSGLVILRGQSLNSWEVGIVQSKTSGSITLTDTLSAAWPKRTKVYPARLARLVFTLETAKKTDDFVEARIGFTLDQRNPYVSDIAFPTYLSSPVLEQRPDESDELSFGYERLLSIVDNDVGLPSYLDTANKTFQTIGYRWSVIGRQKAHDLRQLLSYLRGRARAMWIPTFMQDFTLDSDVASGATTLAVKNVGYTDSGARAAGKQDIRIQLADGTVLYRRITASIVSSATRETLTLSSPIATGFVAGQVVAISHMQLSRMESDSLELRHPTDSVGVTQCDARWRGPTNF